MGIVQAKGKDPYSSQGRVRVAGCRLSKMLSSALVVFALVGCARSRISPPIVTAVQAPSPSEVKAVPSLTIRQWVEVAARREISYRVGPNDVLNIRVFQHPEMDTTARVDGNGFIRLSPLGELKVSGLAERQLESLIQDRLRDKVIKEPHVTVFISEPHPRQIHVFGAVRNAGSLPYSPGMRLIDLLSQAGGLAANAGNVAFVVRYDAPSTPVVGGQGAQEVAAERKLTIDLDGLLLKGEEYWNIPLAPGDVVTVPIPEPGWIHVTGPGVVRPGTYPLITFLGLQGREVAPGGVESLVPYPLTRSSKTLRQAIDEAGGIKFEASKRILVFRRGEDGKERYITLNYNRVLRDTRNDIPLQVRDTVIVNRHPVKYAVALVGRAAAQVLRVTIGMEYDYFAERRARSLENDSTLTTDLP